MPLSETAARPDPTRAYTHPSAEGAASEGVDCPSCGTRVATPHCAECGERRPEPGRLALRHLVREAVEHLVSFDGTFARTLVTLVRRPGALTEAYLRGARVRFTRPVQLFLLINVAFFLAAPRIGLLRYGKTVPAHPTTAGEQARIDGVLATSPVGRVALRRMRDRHERYDQFVARYNAAVEARVSSLIGLQFVPALAALALVCAGRGRYLTAHAVFMLHFAGFVLIWASCGVAAIRLATSAATRLPEPVFVAALLLLVAGPLAAYLVVALRRVYGGGWLAATARGGAVFGALLLSPAPFSRVVEAVTIWSL